MSLSRQLSNATMVRGPGFSVVESINAEALTTLHISGVQHTVQVIQDGMPANVACVFLKGLANMLATVSPGDAITMCVAC